MFLPDSDFKPKGVRYLGPDGARANTSLTLRDYTHHYDRRPPPTKEDKLLPEVTKIASKPLFLKNLADKRTCDFPAGGKVCSRFERPDHLTAINEPLFRPTITGHPKRLKPLDIPEAELKKMWSDGHERALHRVADQFAGKRNVIDHFNVPDKPTVWHTGTRHAGEDNVRKVPPTNYVPGFCGMGNVLETTTNERPNREAAIRTSAVPFNEFKFMGVRKWL